MTLTQHQSIEQIANFGQAASAGTGEQLIITGGAFGTGTPGADVPCGSVGGAYATGNSVTLSTSLDFTCGDTYMFGPPAEPSLRFSDNFYMWFGGFKFQTLFSAVSPNQIETTLVSGWEGSPGPYDVDISPSLPTYPFYPPNPATPSGNQYHYVGTVQLLSPLGGGAYTTQSAQFYPPSGQSGSFSLSFDCLEYISPVGPIAPIGEYLPGGGTYLSGGPQPALAYSLALDPAGSYTVTGTYGSATLTASGTNAGLIALGFTASSFVSGNNGQWQITYRGGLSPNLGNVGQAGAMQPANFSITGFTGLGGSIDLTCAASGPTLLFGSTSVTESVSGGVGDLTYTCNGGGSVYINAGFPTTPGFTAACLDAFGSSSSHLPDLRCGWDYWGYTATVASGEEIAPVIEDLTSWADVPMSGAFQYKVIVPMGVGSFDVATGLATGGIGGVYCYATNQLNGAVVPLTALGQILQYWQPFDGVFKASLHPTWKSNNNWGALPNDIVFLSVGSFAATTLSLASPLTLDPLTALSGWTAANGTVTVSGGTLSFTASAAGASVTNNAANWQMQYYRFLRLTLSGSAANAAVNLGSGPFYCLPALTGTPVTIDLDLCDPHTNYATLDVTQEGSGIVYGPGLVPSFAFVNLANGETLDCTAIEMVQHTPGMIGGCMVTRNSHVWFQSDGRVCDIGPSPCFNSWVAGVNEQTALNGLSASSVGSGTPSTLFNGDLDASTCMDWLAPGADLTSTPLTGRLQSAATACYAGMSGFTVNYRVFVEHFVHGLSSGLSGAVPAAGKWQISSATQASEYPTVDSTTHYYRSATRFPPRTETAALLGTGGATVFSMSYDGASAGSEPGWVWMGSNEELACHTMTAPNNNASVCLLRDYTDRLHIYGTSSGGALQVALYNDSDASPSSATIDVGNCGYPAFYRKGDVLIEGTYLNGLVPKFARSATHGRTWVTTPIPGNYAAQTSTNHYDRIVFLGFKAANSSATPPVIAAWYCRVGVIQDDGTYTWSNEVNLNLTNPSGQGHLVARKDGVLEFAWTDTGGGSYVLRGRGVANNGGLATNWT